MSVRVFKFGLLPPTVNGDRVRDQMRHAHRLYNDCIQIERGRRDFLRSDGLYERIAVAEAAFNESDEEVARLAREVKVSKAQKAFAKKRKVPVPDVSGVEEIRAALHRARVVLKDRRKALAEARRELRQDPEHVKLEDITKDLAGALKRDAYALNGPKGMWGSKQLAMEAAENAIADTPYFDGTTPMLPRFHRWTGEGAVSVQFTAAGGLPSAQAFGANSQLQIEPIDPAAWANGEGETPRRERRRLSRTTVRLRVDSDGRDPVWAEWPMVMHRPLPSGCHIARATVHLRKIGPREEWTLTLTCKSPDVASPEHGGVAAIDLGWRKFGQEMRVASWADDGDAGELRLAEDVLGGIAKADELRSQRDSNFDEAVTKLASWLDGRSNLPSWLADARSTIRHWKSQDRLALLCRRWSTDRFDGDADAFIPLEAWRYHDFHLWSWESSQRRKALLRRREEYRIFAARLVSVYGTIVLEDFDLSKVARKKAPEAKWDNQHSRANRQRAATSELRDAIKNVASRVGAKVVMVPAEQSTHTCHACGKVDSFDAAMMVTHACSGCGTVWDQDENAAKVLLKRYRESLSGDQTPGGSRNGGNGNDSGAPQETRRQRANRLHRERQERLETARNPGQNAAE